MDEIKKDKSWTTIFTRIVLPIFFVGGLIAIGYLVYSLLVRENKNHIKYDLGASLQTDDGLFSEYSYNNDSNYPFTQSELSRLEKDFLTTQYYGPELAEINGIVLGNRNVIEPDSGTWGLTIPQTKQIFIDTTSLQEAIPNLYPSSATEQEKYEQKRDFVFSVLAHEYGHEYTSTYFNNLNQTSIRKNTADNTIFYSINDNGVSKRVNEYWNSQYITDFKNVFNIDGTPYSDTTQPEIVNGNSTNISSKYSLSKLYHMSNDLNQTLIDPSQNKTLDYVGPDTLDNKQPYIQFKTLTDEQRKSKSTQSLYLYSQDEMGTRMLQQLFYADSNPYSISKSTLKFNISRGGDYEYWHPYMQDLLMTTSFDKLSSGSQELTPYILFPNYIWGGSYTYLQSGSSIKSTLTNRAEEYYENLLNGMGYADQISKVWFKNTTSTLDGQTIMHFNDSKYYNKNLLRWAGYVNDSKYKYIIPLKVEEGGEISMGITGAIPILIQNYGSVDKSSFLSPAFNFFAKKNRDASEPSDDNRSLDKTNFWTPETTGKFSNQSSYVTEDYVKANLLQEDLNLGYQLYFSESPEKPTSISNVQLINTINSFGQQEAQSQKYVSSFPQGNFILSSSRGDNSFWEFQLSNNSLKLELYDWGN